MAKKTPEAFKKFEHKDSNAAKKEKFKQEKRKYKKERAAFFEQKKAEAAQKGHISRKSIEKPAKETNNTTVAATTDQMPLNKFIAHTGYCARRNAADLIKTGVVKVNGAVITEPGHKVAAHDTVMINNKKVFISKNVVYILLNKPKDYITTTDDPQQRKTVLALVQKATTERVFPVGRLDRNTSGVLLLTNDGELAQLLTHPSNEIRKIYHVGLNKTLQPADFEKIRNGVVLEDGPAPVDAIAYNDATDGSQVGVEIHSGKNRIVRRIFESLGYDVKTLDRVSFAGLTKKNVERGKWRYLSEAEVRSLKYFKQGNKSGASKKKSTPAKTTPRKPR